MKRPIKFRGLRVDGLGWVYGYLFEDIATNRHLSYILEGGMVPALSMPTNKFIEVIPSTVDQFTGYSVLKKGEWKNESNNTLL